MARRRTATTARPADNLFHEPPLPEGPENTVVIFTPRLRPASPAEPAEGLPTVWDPRYSVKAAPLNSTEKQARVVALATRERLLDVREAPFDADATWRNIATAGLSCVAIVDLDAHQGDGTWDLAKDDPRIAIFDIACGPLADVESDDRVEYHEAADAAAYARALNRLPHFLDRTRPGLVQYQAGADAWEGDPVGGIPGVTEPFLAARDHIVIDHVLRRGIPIVINLGGGYAADELHVATARTAVSCVRRSS